MSVQILPTIKKLEYISVLQMELVPKKILVPGESISVLGEFEKLNISEPVQVEITSQQTDNGLIYTTRATGSIFDEKNEDLRHKLQVLPYNYCITDVYNNKYLIGAKEDPYPEILFNPVNPASQTDKRTVNFEIVWLSTLPPINIIDL